MPARHGQLAVSGADVVNGAALPGCHPPAFQSLPDLVVVAVGLFG